VLARGGATTLAEIGALAKPALIVPYPFAAADEQTTNARGLAEAGAVEVMADAELDEPLFIERLVHLLIDAELRASMSAAFRALGTPRAREELVGLILAMVENRPVR
jgi:UDP-N-acetylglucosamine--N-acetylmuramyl-(pentapeptide) pyrophosphoryl-undecaprenol N-acetylglucosamine transferase